MTLPPEVGGGGLCRGRGPGRAGDRLFPPPQRRGRVLDRNHVRDAHAPRPAGWTAGRIEASGPPAAFAERMQAVVANVKLEYAPRAAGTRRAFEHAVACAAPDDQRGGPGATSDRDLA